MKKMIIMRGVPGSGKSTKAKVLAAENSGVVFSTDDFFMVDGEYRFNAKLLHRNHRANQRRAREAAEQSLPYIIIDNTIVRGKEAKAYCLIAKEFGYDVEFVESDTPWCRNARECAAKNTHGVPLEKIKQMLARWEDGVTLDSVLRNVQ